MNRPSLDICDGDLAYIEALDTENVEARVEFARESMQGMAVSFEAGFQAKLDSLLTEMKGLRFSDDMQDAFHVFLEDFENNLIQLSESTYEIQYTFSFLEEEKVVIRVELTKEMLWNWNRLLMMRNVIFHLREFVISKNLRQESLSSDITNADLYIQRNESDLASKTKDEREKIERGIKDRRSTIADKNSKLSKLNEKLLGLLNLLNEKLDFSDFEGFYEALDEYLKQEFQSEKYDLLEGDYYDSFMKEEEYTYESNQEAGAKSDLSIGEAPSSPKHSRGISGRRWAVALGIFTVLGLGSRLLKGNEHSNPENLVQELERDLEFYLAYYGVNDVESLADVLYEEGRRAAHEQALALSGRIEIGDRLQVPMNLDGVVVPVSIVVANVEELSLENFAEYRDRYAEGIWRSDNFYLLRVYIWSDFIEGDGIYYDLQIPKLERSLNDFFNALNLNSEDELITVVRDRLNRAEERGEMNLNYLVRVYGGYLPLGRDINLRIEETRRDDHTGELNGVRVTLLFSEDLRFFSDEDSLSRRSVVYDLDF